MLGGQFDAFCSRMQKKTHSNSFRELLNAFKNAMCVGGQKQRGEEAKRKEIGLNPPKERTPQKGKLMQFFKGTTLVPTLPHTTFACVCATSFFSRFLLVFCASEILNHGASAGASIYRSDPSLYFFKDKSQVLEYGERTVSFWGSFGA